MVGGEKLRGCLPGEEPGRKNLAGYHFCCQVRETDSLTRFFDQATASLPAFTLKTLGGLYLRFLDGAQPASASAPRAEALEKIAAGLEELSDEEITQLHKDTRRYLARETLAGRRRAPGILAE